MDEKVAALLQAAREIQKVTVQGVISKAGRTQIARVLNARYPTRVGLDDVQSWDLAWTVSDSKNQSLSTRVKTWLFKVYKIKADNSILEEIGNIASENSLSVDRDAYFSIKDDLVWNAGDFGDPKSCFFSNAKHAITVLQDNKANALCFWLDAEGSRGIGRAWMFECEEGIVLFNFYGEFFRGDDTYRDNESGRADQGLVKASMALATYLGLEYTKVSLLINGAAGDPVYINNGVAVLLTPKPTYISRLDIPMEDKTIYRCLDCGDMKRITSAEEAQKYFHEVEGNLLCARCFNSKYFTCLSCSVVKRADERQATAAGYICKECAKGLERCHRCGSFLDMKDTLHSDDNLAFCRSCFPRSVSECQRCTKKYTADNLNRVGVCAECVEQAKKLRKKLEKVIGEPMRLPSPQVTPADAPIFAYGFDKTLMQIVGQEMPKDSTVLSYREVAQEIRARFIGASDLESAIRRVDNVLRARLVVNNE